MIYVWAPILKFWSLRWEKKEEEIFLKTKKQTKPHISDKIQSNVYHVCIKKIKWNAQDAFKKLYIYIVSQNYLIFLKAILKHKCFFCI